MNASPPAVPMPDMLARICADTRTETARRKQATPLAALKSEIAAAAPPRGFGRAIKAAAARGGVALITEIKKASPSGGLIRPDFDPPALARAYRDGGAVCLSVLTDTPYFQGEPAHLRAARDAVDLPVLRKDFILDPWQVHESRAMGADCILLILAALTDAEALELGELARSLDMDVLAEVHDQAELDRALGLPTDLIGINNRNLRTLTTDLGVSQALAPQIPPERVPIAESGIRSHADIAALRARGVLGFLVGEHLMRQADVAAATRALRGEAA